MNDFILEYLRLVLSWPAVALLIVLILRKHIRLFLSLIHRGIEAKFAGIYFKIPPLEIKDEETDGTFKRASVTLANERVPILSEFHTKILKKFYEKGDYDTLNVSRNLIETFRELKELGYIDWESEAKNDGNFILTDFILTKTGKKIVESMK
jgi:hypothetical protein